MLEASDIRNDGQYLDREPVLAGEGILCPLLKAFLAF